jgi:FkbM family methyltransferase
MPSGVNLEEWIKDRLIPPRLYIRYKALKELRRGEAEVRLLPFLVDRHRVALDIGANKGTYSYFLARLARQVHAFEPNPKMLHILQRTAAGNVAVSPYALSDQTGSAVLRVPRGRKGLSNQGGSLSATKVKDNFASVEIQSRRIDDLGIADIGFIKIDVEGHEQAVLEGARETIARDRPNLLIEMEEAHTGEPIEQSIARVVSLGYRCLFLDRDVGALRAIEDFDPLRQHRQPTGAYVFNFIFLPV